MNTIQERADTISQRITFWTRKTQGATGFWDHGLSLACIQNELYFLGKAIFVPLLSWKREWRRGVYYFGFLQKLTLKQKFRHVEFIWDAWWSVLCVSVARQLSLLIQLNTNFCEGILQKWLTSTVNWPYIKEIVLYDLVGFSWSVERPKRRIEVFPKEEEILPVNTVPILPNSSQPNPPALWSVSPPQSWSITTFA